MEIPVAQPGPYRLTVEHGRLHVLGDGHTIWYDAPLENAVDRYRVNGSQGSPAIAAGEIIVDMPPPATLAVTEVLTRHVAGRYGDVEFDATAEADDQATATFRSPASPDILQITVTADDAWLEWGRQRIDAHEALTTGEAQTLHELSTGSMARGLTMVALDLGCRERAEALPDAIYAALLFPWQMILRYEVAKRESVIRHFLSASTCRFADLGGSDPGKPVNDNVVWMRDVEMPVAPGFTAPFAPNAPTPPASSH